MDLGRTQVLSLVTKAVTTALGIIQSLIVIRLLGPANFGLVGLVMSIGGVIGVSQHLGIVDGAIREIAVLKSRREIGKVFWVSHIVRQLVTIPLSIALVLLAGVIAQRIYGRPEITLFLQIFAAALVLQGLQDVLGATLTGLKKFTALYGVQIATAAINIAVFGYLTWQFGITGFFWAVIITTGVMVAWFAAIIARELKGHLSLPTLADLTQYGRRVLRVGAYMYLARIFFVVWQRLPLLLLGGALAAEELGYLNVSLTFGARLAIIAMALAEVNLSWMSSLFVHRPQEFQRTVARNMQRVFLVMFGLTAALMFFTPEIVQYIIGPEYIPAEGLIYVMTFAFFLYSLLDIGTSSVFVPADQPRLRALVYGFQVALSGIVIAWLLLTNPDPWLATWGVLAGVGLAYSIMVWLVRGRFHVQLLSPAAWGLLAALAASMIWLLSAPSLWVRILVLIVLSAAAAFEAWRAGLLPSRVSSRDTVSSVKVIGFGTTFDSSSWTNRQHVLSRVAHVYPVLYVEPREWIVRFFLRHWSEPARLAVFLWRLIGYQRRGEQLYLISQWNLIPGSREYKAIAVFNHWLNRWRILLVARMLGFRSPKTVLWLYETEAAEYLSAWPDAKVFYDCVDDHAAQAGAERNPNRVQEEEEQILQRATIVTVTSKRLYELKRAQHSNVHLVLNAGDVPAFAKASAGKGKILPVEYGPVLGTVGALDGYKVDFELLEEMARRKPGWQLVLIGEPVVDKDRQAVERLTALPNVHWLGAMAREQVPAYVHQFDVCLIPYRANLYNAASFPLKFWEFMATGKPLVITGVPELKEYQGLVSYAEGTQEFIAMCEMSLEGADQDRDARIRMAREHSWEKRVEQLLELLHTIVK